MVGFAEGVANAVRKGYCDVMAAGRNYENLMANALGLTGIPQVDPAGFLYNLVCDRAPPSLDPTFPGGQCPVSYDVYYGFTKSFVDAVSKAPYYAAFDSALRARGIGPVSGVTVEGVGSNGYRIKTQFANSVHYTDAINPSNAIANTSVSVSGVRVIRSDNQQDTCGNKPRQYGNPSPGDNMTGGDVNYTNNEGNNVTIPVVLVFGYANVLIDGTVNIPVKVNFSLNPQLNVDVNFNLNNGTVKPVDTTPLPPGNNDPTGNPTPSPDPSLPPIGNPDTPPPDITPPVTNQPATLRVIKAVIVSAAGVDRSLSVVDQNPNAALILPDLGQVQFKCNIKGTTVWTPHQKVQSLNELIPCPWYLGATDVKGTPRLGITWRLTPVYVTQTYDTKFPPDFSS